MWRVTLWDTTVTFPKVPVPMTLTVSKSESVALGCSGSSAEEGITWLVISPTTRVAGAQEPQTTKTGHVRLASMSRLMMTASVQFWRLGHSRFKCDTQYIHFMGMHGSYTLVSSRMISNAC